MRLKDVKQGDRFTEGDRGLCILMKALETAHEVDDDETGMHGHVCRAKVLAGDTCMADKDGVLTLFECHNPGAYGLKLYPARGKE